MGLHCLSEAQMLSLGEENAPFGGPPKRAGKLVKSEVAPAEIRECMGSGRRLNILRRSDLSLERLSSGLKRRGIFCDLFLIPRFPTTELAVLGRSSVFPAGRTFRMYLSHLVTGRQLDYFDATSCILKW